MKRQILPGERLAARPAPSTGGTAEDGPEPREGTRHTLTYGQYRLSYEVYGSGDRVLVWMHGLLLDANLSRGLARRLAAKGNRVVLLDLLGMAGATSPATLAPTGWIFTPSRCCACWTSSARTRWFWEGSRWVPT